MLVLNNQEAETQLEAQKKDSEERMERQLQLCDRLLKEKTELTKRISLLAEELQTMERKFQVLTLALRSWSATKKARIGPAVKTFID